MKKYLIALVTAIMCVCCLGLFACGGSGGSGSASTATSTGSASASAATSASADTSADKQAIETAMKANIASFKEGTMSSSSALADDPELAANLQTLGIDPVEFGNAINSKCDLQMGEIKVNGDTATVEIQIIAPDYNSIDATFEKTIDDILAQADTSSMSQQDLAATIGAALMDAINNDLGTVSTPFTVQYEKTGGEWRIKNMSELESAVRTAFGI